MKSEYIINEIKEHMSGAVIDITIDDNINWEDFQTNDMQRLSDLINKGSYKSLFIDLGNGYTITV